MNEESMMNEVYIVYIFSVVAVWFHITFTVGNIETVSQDIFANIIIFVEE